MFIRYISRAGSAARALLVSRVFLSMLVSAAPAAASADAMPELLAASGSEDAERRRTAAQQARRAAPACVSPDRPKHEHKSAT